MQSYEERMVLKNPARILDSIFHQESLHVGLVLHSFILEQTPIVVTVLRVIHQMHHLFFGHADLLL